jgi:hypothetical protein
MRSRDKVLLVAMALILCLGGAFQFVVRPKRAEIAALDGQVAAAQARLAGGRSGLAQLRADLAHGGRGVETVRAARRALPDGPALAAFLHGLDGMARRGNVRLTQLSTGGADGSVPTGTGGVSPSPGAASPSAAASGPGAPAAALPPGVTPVPLSLSFQGRFADLQRLLGRLHGSVRVRAGQVVATGRLVSLQSVKLGPAGSGGSHGGGSTPRLQADVQATVYVLDPAALRAAAAAASAPTAGGSGA